jgi:DNA-binding HxlR family transcriptional regulator
MRHGNYLFFASVGSVITFKNACLLQAFYECIGMIQKRRSFCPINFGLEIFGDKWSLLIIRDLAFKGKSLYREFMGSEEKIATNILAGRLQKLESSGIIERKTGKDSTRPYYTLTAKGVDLVPMLVELILWSAKYDKQTAADKDFVRQARSTRSELIAGISRNLLRKS